MAATVAPGSCVGQMSFAAKVKRTVYNRPERITAKRSRFRTPRRAGGMKERTPDADTLDEIDSTLFLSGLVPGSSADSTVSVGPGDNRQRRKGHVGRQLSCFTALRKRLLSSSSPRDERGLQTGPFWYPLRLVRPP
jgi:hypothetical protein